MFLEQLQDVLDGVPNGDFLILVGDFNARAGVLNPQDDLWHGVVELKKEILLLRIFYNFVSVTNYLS